MDKIVSEIIIGAIILTLLISVVPIYRSSAELVGSVGEKMDVNENIKEVTIGRLPAAGDVCSGRYLLELIEYSATKYHFSISVEFSDVKYQFRNEAYKDAFQIIKNDMLFEVFHLEKDGDYVEMYFSYQNAE